jgi:hypothetical protein
MWKYISIYIYSIFLIIITFHDPARKLLDSVSPILLKAKESVFVLRVRQPHTVITGVTISVYSYWLCLFIIQLFKYLRRTETLRKGTLSFRCLH